MQPTSGPSSTSRTSPARQANIMFRWTHRPVMLPPSSTGSRHVTANMGSITSLRSADNTHANGLRPDYGHPGVRQFHRNVQGCAHEDALPRYRSDAERALYRVTVERPDGSRDQIVPVALADLGDGDNNHHLCLDTSAPAVSVDFPAGHLVDPNRDLNPDTHVAVDSASPAAARP